MRTALGRTDGGEPGGHDGERTRKAGDGRHDSRDDPLDHGLSGSLPGAQVRPRRASGPVTGVSRRPLASVNRPSRATENAGDTPQKTPKRRIPHPMEVNLLRFRRRRMIRHRCPAIGRMRNTRTVARGVGPRGQTTPEGAAVSPQFVEPPELMFNGKLAARAEASFCRPPVHGRRAENGTVRDVRRLRESRG